MTTRRPARAVVLIAATALAGGLSACSEDPDEAYCETLREESQVLADLAGRANEPGSDVLGRTLGSLRTLQADAPAELGDEYTTVVNAWEAMTDAVADAGVDPADYDRRETLRDLDPDDARRLRQTASELGAARVVDASAGIEDHAQQVCGVDFGV